MNGENTKIPARNMLNQPNQKLHAVAACRGTGRQGPTIGRMSPSPNRSNTLSAVGQLAEDGLHHILGYQLAQASVTTTQVFNDEVGKSFELRPVEFTILTLVDENPGVSAKQLALTLAVAPPNITVWIDRLERRGLVQRERSISDRRAQHIRTTTQGSELARQALQRIVAAERLALARLSAAERAILVELLHKVAGARGKPRKG